MIARPSGLILFGAVTTLVGVVALVMTVRTVTGLSQTAALYNRKTADLRTLAGLRQQTLQQRAIVAGHAEQAEAPAPLSVVLREALPGREAALRDLDPLPTLPGWAARRTRVTFTDIAGDEMGRFLDDAARRQPAWALLECTLVAAPTPGRLAKAELVLCVVTRDANR